MGESYTLSRRGFVASTGLAVAAAWLMPGHTRAQDDSNDGPVQTIRKGGGSATIAVEALRGNVSVLSGSGGNIAVLQGAGGKVMVDSGVSKANVLAALDGIGSGPVRYLINTHWHFDHTDGNAWLNAAGATILAHENTRRRMAASTRVEGWNFTFPPAPRGALPTVGLDAGGTTLHLDDVPISIASYGPCHTDTDVRVTFPDADVVHVGDTWWNGHYPFIDYSTGGSIDGMIRATSLNVDIVGNDTIAIPGHGPVGDKRQLIEYRDMLRTIRDAVAALKRQGRSAAEAIAANPTAAYDAKWGTFVISPATFTQLVYAGV
jgi:glyoxylase-like metal-dependent hydrolase (beta-lactamase superfamily II)